MQVANSITAERQTANNGILYMLDDPRDVGRYRVMSPAELKRERAVYDDAAATVQRRGGVIATSKRKDKVGPPVGEKIIGPPVGQKARQAQKRAWDEKIKEKKATNPVTATSVVGPISGSSNRSTVGYSMSKPPGSQLVSAYQSMSVSRPVEADRLAASGLNNSELETLKYKYAQNLSVIEQLAAEKEEMARTINALKSGKGMPQETFDGDRAESLTGSDMSLPKYTEEPEGDKFAWKPQQASHRLSAAEASHLFEISPNRERGRTYLRSSNARSTSGSRDPRDRSGFGGTPGSPAGFVRSRSFDAPRRSSSVPRSKANGSTGISYELQADYDRCVLCPDISHYVRISAANHCLMPKRYLQKKRNLQENERRAAQEKEMYEEEQRQRFLRVRHPLYAQD